MLIDYSSMILKQPHLGTGIKERKKQLTDMKKLAKKEGFGLVLEEEYQELMKWKESTNKGEK